jgi:putative flippase GtrA
MGSIISRIRGLVRTLSQKDFVRFCMVGFIGFLINLVILKLLHDAWHWPIILATLIGAEAAYLSNFLFHNSWTYKHKPKVEKSFKKLLVQFHLSAWSGMLLNTIIVYIAVTFFHQDSAIGLVIASAVVLFWNYMWTKFYIWRDHHTEGAPLPKVVASSQKIS